MLLFYGDGDEKGGMKEQNTNISLFPFQAKITKNSNRLFRKS